MRELEQQLGQLKGRHSDLSRSYESLQVEYASVKQELDKLRKENERFEKSPSTVSGFPGEPAWKESKDGNLDPLLFDVSEFCVDQEEGESHKG
jgi:chromosome segregation ATPase